MRRTKSGRFGKRRGRKRRLRPKSKRSALALRRHRVGGRFAPERKKKRAPKWRKHR